MFKIMFRGRGIHPLKAASWRMNTAAIPLRHEDRAVRRLHYKLALESWKKIKDLAGGLPGKAGASGQMSSDEPRPATGLHGVVALSPVVERMRSSNRSVCRDGGRGAALSKAPWRRTWPARKSLPGAGEPAAASKGRRVSRRRPAPHRGQPAL